MSHPVATVHVNREPGTGESLESSTDTVRVRDPFDVKLVGHDRPAHVHCRLGGDLSRVASLPQSNYYVEADDDVRVPIDVAPVDEPVEGVLELLTGYGSESVTIRVTVETGPPSVAVDDSLGEPRRREPDRSDLERALDEFSTDTGIEPATLAVVALGLVALAIAVATAATVGGDLVSLGVAAVVGCVLVALAVLRW